MDKTFHEELKQQMNEAAHAVYALTRKFPKEELYGVVSQFRRATLSIVLNYIEGYARQRDKVHKNFLEISYGSLQEAKYLLDFSFEEQYIDKKEYGHVASLFDRIGKMLWGILKRMNDQ